MTNCRITKIFKVLRNFWSYDDWESHYGIAELQKFLKSLEIFWEAHGQRCNVILVSFRAKKFN